MRIIFSAFVYIAVLLSGCTKPLLEKTDVLDIIPKPQSIKTSDGKFTINSGTKILYDSDFTDIQKVVDYFNGYLIKSSGYKLTDSDNPQLDNNYIYLKFDPAVTNDEGYSMVVAKNGITVSASTTRGIFYGIQTLLQSLPPEIYSQKIEDFSLDVPFAEINDEPRFKWRGVHLDVGRYFYPKEYIKKYIDYMALHKMRQFHWHLTEDQGWRIEIKKYPKLTEVGAWRKETAGDGQPYGGYYTQDDVREIVQYAADRFITVIPEIEMPGHSLAALAAYPEYACTTGPFEVGTIWGVHKDVYCAGNENTYEFLEDILSEVIELFPGTYIHIGGDECPKDRWMDCKKCQAKIKKENLKDEHELQSYFIQRIEKFLLTKNRKIIGWDEILEGGLAPQATVMSWRGIQGGIDAAKQKHDVIMTPTSHCYFDYYQGNPENEPVAIGGYLPLSKVYSYEPVPEELSPEEGKYILGTQANMWTEYLPEFKDVEYMLLPRLAALSEVCWTNKESKNLDEFLVRLATQLKRYDFLGINYAKSSFNVTIGTSFIKESNSLEVELQTEFAGADIYYTFDGTDPNENSIQYNSPFVLNESKVIRAVSYKSGNLMSSVTSKTIVIHKAFGKPVKLTYPYVEKYSAGGNFALVDGMYGSSSFSAGSWQGFEQNDFEAVIDLEKATEINLVESSYLQNINSWIFLPEYVEYSFSSDGVNFTKSKKIENDIPETSGEIITKKFIFEPQNLDAKYIKVFAKNIEECPDWHLGAGGKAWIFVDEIVVE